MTDPFPMLGDLPPEPPSFEDAVRVAVERLNTAATRFAELQAAVDEASLQPEEWRVIQQAAEALEQAVERAEEGYVAVAFDSHAWYRIMESLDDVNRRLESACGILEHARVRSQR